MGCWYSTSRSAECTPSCCITFICKSSYSALRDSLYHLPFTDAQLSSPQVSGWPLKALFKNECDVSPSAPVVPRHFNSYCGIVLNRSAVSSLCSLRVLEWKCLLLVICYCYFYCFIPRSAILTLQFWTVSEAHCLWSQLPVWGRVAHPQMDEWVLTKPCRPCCPFCSLQVGNKAVTTRVDISEYLGQCHGPCVMHLQDHRIM